MSSGSHITKIPKWQRPTSEQRLSHRSILRFVELAEQLARDLRGLLLPKSKRDEDGVLDAYFVSVDRHGHKDLEPHWVGRSVPVRYYNLRLLKTFRLTDDSKEEFSIKPVWDWIKEHYAEFRPLFQCADYLEDHSRDHYALFAQCIADAAIAAEGTKQERDIAARVHDILVEAIAAMPYTGLLPSALDRWFYDEEWCREETVPVRFHLKYSDRKVLFSSSRKRDSKAPAIEIPLTLDTDKLIPVKAFRVPEQAKIHAADLGKLYVKFINWFTLGSVPKVPKDGSSKQCPYQSVIKDLQGFALPIYHYHDRAGNPSGGFEGWAIFMGKQHKDAYAKLRTKESEVMLAIRAFSRRIREERMRELLEKEWRTTSDRRVFTLEHFGEFDGWIAEQSDYERLPTLEDHWQFAFLAGKEEEMDSPEGTATRLRFTLFDKPGPDSPREHDRRKVTHIAVYPPADRDQMSERKALLFRRRQDTTLPISHDDLVDYGFHITQAVGQIFNAARLKENARQSATRLLAKDFAHQVQHISGALSGGWLIKEDNYRKLTGPSSKSSPEIRVAPLPELYQFADDVLKLWSTQRATDLFGSDLLTRSAVSLADILSVAASLAKAEWIAENAKGYSLHLPGRIEEVQKLIGQGKTLTSECDFSDLASISILREDTRLSNEALLACVRLFQTLVFNAFRHSKSAVVAHRTHDNPQAFSLKNALNKQCKPPSDGESVIQSLARQAGLEVHQGECKISHFKRLIINLGTPWTIS